MGKWALRQCIAVTLVRLRSVLPIPGGSLVYVLCSRTVTLALSDLD
jgi:hypothetical protein